MGGGDLNAKKAWHPSTLKNQERVWKAEQAAAEEKKRIMELERERHLERERAELNKLAKSNSAPSNLTGDDRLHWMYEKPDKKIQQEEYLLGKALDKNHEQAGKSAADEIPAVSRRVVGSSMLTVSGDTQVDLARKMREDPLLLVKERERAARAALLNNPVQRARLTELLRKEQSMKNDSKSKKKKKKSKDLDNILAEKLQALSGKKNIDLASLLASDDSSSESSDEKYKKKKKKKKSKSKKSLDDNESEEERHISKYDSKNFIKKGDKQKKNIVESDSDNITRKKRHNSIKRSKSHNKRNRDTSEDHQSSDDDDSDNKQNSKHKSKIGSKKYKNLDKPKKITTEYDNVGSKRKKRQHSIEDESGELHIKKHHKHSSDDYQSSDDQQNKDVGQINTPTSYVREDRYWNHKQYNTDYQKFKSYHRSKDEYLSNDVTVERNSRKEKHLGDNQHRNKHDDRQRLDSSHRNRKDLQDDYKNERDKDRCGQNFSASEKAGRSNKRSGLSEAEKAAKLAEMVAAGAEREKQRERRVADQLAEKEKEDRPGAHSRSRNVVRQLPDSLESRIHSNRHYIQRDQRHMNENFARR